MATAPVFRRARRILTAAAAAVGLAELAAPAPLARGGQGAGTYFSDDIEGDVSGWVPGGNWSVVAGGQYHSPTHAWHFGSVVNSGSLKSPPIDLQSAVAPVLRFWYSSNFDDGLVDSAVYATLDNGAHLTLLKAYSETGGVFKQDTVDLAPYAGAAALRLVFMVFVNGQPSFFRLDDVEVLEQPPPGPFAKTAPVLLAEQLVALESGVLILVEDTRYRVRKLPIGSASG